MYMIKNKIFLIKDKKEEKDVPDNYKFIMLNLVMLILPEELI